MAEQVNIVKAKEEQRRKAKRATLADLLEKPPRERELSIVLSKDVGPVTFLLRSISNVDFDKLVTKHPPTLEQKAESANYNQNTFAPALLAVCVVEPEASAAEWDKIWNGKNWSRGEIGDLFFACMGLCNSGLELDPTVAD